MEVKPERCLELKYLADLVRGQNVGCEGGEEFEQELGAWLS